jgi:hydroxymethylpyrimidine pyrophosphatase-like HAD family hydrolase
VVSALKRYRAAGGRLFLVTGETVEDLATFPQIDLFDHIVAENGAVLFNANLGDERVLSEADPVPVIEAFREIGATEVKSGRVVVSAKEDKRRIQEALARRNLNWKVIRNRGDLLILPRGIDKASGLAALLVEFDLAAHNVAAIGDAENDRPMIEFCGLGAAVANAVPILKANARMVTRGRAGRGMIELIEAILRDDVL